MAVRRIGHTRPPDSGANIWNASPGSAFADAKPGDALFNAPGYGGQALREAPSPIITERDMAVHEPPTPVKKPVGRPRKERLEPEPQTRLRAVLPENAKRVAKLPQRQKSTRVNINLRMPMELLVQYKLGGPGYQTRMIAVLQMFLDEDGEFVEEIMESP